MIESQGSISKWPPNPSYSQVTRRWRPASWSQTKWPAPKFISLKSQQVWGQVTQAHAEYLLSPRKASQTNLSCHLPPAAPASQH